MKKIFLVLLFLGLSLTGFSQNKYLKTRAHKITEYVSTRMEFNKKETKFLESVLLVKITDVNKKINNKTLTKEDKQAIYKESYLWTKNELEKKFTNKEVKEIFALMKEENSKRK